MSKPYNTVTSATGPPRPGDRLAEALPLRSSPKSGAIQTRGGKAYVPTGQSLPVAAPLPSPAPPSGVSTVYLSMPTTFSVSGGGGSGIVSLVVTYAAQAANTFLAGTGTGAAFRALLSADLPLATALLAGAVKPDGSTITIAGGVLSAAASGFTPAAAQAPSSVIYLNSFYSGTSEAANFRAENTVSPSGGAIEYYGWQGSTDGVTWGAESFHNDTFQTSGMTSGSKYVRCRAYPLVASGVTPTPSGWVTSAAHAYVAPASGGSSSQSITGGAIQIAGGYQVVPGNVLYSQLGWLIGDGSAGESATGYNGGPLTTKPSSATFQSSNSLATGIIGAWPLQEGSGTAVADVSGHGLNLSFVGTSPVWGTGPNGAILTFGGAGALTIADNALLKPTSGFTFSCYASFNNTQSGAPRMFRKYLSSGAYFGVATSAGSYQTAGSTYSGTYNTASYENAYHLYTVTTNTTTNTQTFYVDGVAIGTATGSGALTWDTTNLYLMGSPTGSDYAAGKLDVAYEWSRALSSTEVAALAANPYLLLSSGAACSALFDAGANGYIVASTVEFVRGYKNTLTEVLEYSDDGAAWTNVPIGVTPGSNGGTYGTVATTVTTGVTGAHRYWRYSGKDSGGTNQFRLTDFRIN